MRHLGAIPLGTLLRQGPVVAQNTGRELDEVAVLVRLVVRVALGPRDDRAPRDRAGAVGVHHPRRPRPGWDRKPTPDAGAQYNPGRPLTSLLLGERQDAAGVVHAETLRAQPLHQLVAVLRPAAIEREIDRVLGAEVLQRLAPPELKEAAVRVDETQLHVVARNQRPEAFRAAGDLGETLPPGLRPEVAAVRLVEAAAVALLGHDDGVRVLQFPHRAGHKFHEFPLDRPWAAGYEPLEHDVLAVGVQVRRVSQDVMASVAEAVLNPERVLVDARQRAAVQVAEENVEFRHAYTSRAA